MTATTPRPGRMSTDVDIVGRTLDTPIGPMLACATDRGVCRLEFVDADPPDARPGLIDTGPSEHLEQLEREIAAYFKTGEARFTVGLDPRGTEFQRSVWNVLRTIPCGQTRSYADIARAIGRPAAVRAVARANGDNPIAILIPCHRVIGSDGTLTGYGGGLWRKEQLLHLEGARLFASTDPPSETRNRRSTTR
ncbi:MAG TPA: methylated-DNA--[protein]-cysteine S-methyltransferase [Phycisphaerales bacterium]|nr:methylated-DNA--[protein]-cysteine S-methyltransferase [Phycisphaerales bacterium]